MKRSGRGRIRKERVEAARRQGALALGRDRDQRDLFVEPPTSRPPASPATPSSAPSSIAGDAIGVLSIGEAAARLGLSRSQLEAMIDCDAVETLPTGFTRMIPTVEVERLLRTRGNG